MSLSTHTLLALFLILVVFQNQPGGSSLEPLRQASIVLTVNNETQPEYLTETDVEPSSASEPASTTAAAASDPAPPINLDALDPPPVAGFNAIESLVTDANQMADVPDGRGLETEMILSEDDLKLIEADRKLIESRQPVGDPTSINVFGSGNLTGRDFVFVLDRSHSMGDSGLGVIQASRRELGDAINQLEEHHQFQIVAYHDKTVTMKTRKLLAATDRNKAGVAEFIGRLAAFGGTEHEKGLMAAIAFRPDVIVLLTDGGYPELNPGQLKILRQLTASKTQIHCIQFGSGPVPQTGRFMKQLAADNRGTYKYIDVNHWNQAP